MKIIYKQGDLLDAPEPWIVHGCNTQGSMSSVVARGIRNKWPEAYTAYITGYNYCKENNIDFLGQVPFVGSEDKFIFNAITQEFYGAMPNKVYVSYAAIENCFQQLDEFAKKRYNMYYDDFPTIAMPKIGAGLGGGDWNIIEEIIERCSDNFQPVVYEL